MEPTRRPFGRLPRRGRLAAARTVLRRPLTGCRTRAILSAEARDGPSRGALDEDPVVLAAGWGRADRGPGRRRPAARPAGRPAAPLLPARGPGQRHPGDHAGRPHRTDRRWSGRDGAALRAGAAAAILVARTRLGAADRDGAGAVGRPDCGAGAVPGGRGRRAWPAAWGSGLGALVGIAGGDGGDADPTDGGGPPGPRQRRRDRGAVPWGGAAGGGVARGARRRAGAAAVLRGCLCAAAHGGRAGRPAGAARARAAARGRGAAAAPAGRGGLAGRRIPKRDKPADRYPLDGHRALRRGRRARAETGPRGRRDPLPHRPPGDGGGGD